MTPEKRDELEKFIHAQLTALPGRRAPSTLEARVLAALEQRALIPWYHKSFTYWPVPVRIGFLVLAIAVAVGVALAFSVGFNGVETSGVVTHAGERLSLLTKLYAVVPWTTTLAAQIFHSIPPLWLYTGLAGVALLYATFVGLGAAAYRTLYRSN